MKGFVQRLSAHPNYLKALVWGKLITISGSAQVIVQATSLIGGILVIRLLPTEEYALYTLANTMLGTMTILADGGISNGLMSEGGKVWQNRQKLGAVLVTGLDLRKKFAIGSLVIALPVLLLLLRNHGATWLMSALIIVSIIPAFFTTLSGTILEVAPKLRQDILPLQQNQVGSYLGRLAILCLTLFAFPWAFVAIAASAIPQIFANLRLRRISKPYADWHQPIDPVVRKEILHVVRRLLPTAIYYCVSGQVTIWLISIFGTTAAIAQIGALSRLAMMLSLFNVLFATLVVPRFARLVLNKQLLLKRYLQIQAGLVLLCVCIISGAWIFQSQVLWILGNQYMGLTKELVLNITGSCLNLIAAISFILYTSRGWVIKPVISIPINIIAISLAAAIFDISSLQGILILNIFTAAVQVIMNAYFSVYKIMKVA